MVSLFLLSSVDAVFVLGFLLSIFGFIIVPSNYQGLVACNTTYYWDNAEIFHMDSCFPEKCLSGSTLLDCSIIDGDKFGWTISIWSFFIVWSLFVIGRNCHNRNRTV